MIKWIIIILFIYYFSLSSLDCKYLWLTIKNRKLIGNNDSVSFHLFLKFLLIPFCSKNYFSRITEGAIYNSYAYEKFPYVTEQMNDKLFWYHFFQRVGIPTPQILNEVIPDEYYIVKPRKGTRGKGVRKMLGKNITFNEEEVVQPIVSDCSYKGSRTFRVVTLYNGDLFRVAEYTNNKLITSNHATGGNVDENAIHKLDPSIVDKLLKVHTQYFPFIFSIGWDVMLGCDSYYVLEGNVFHAAFVPETTPEDQINWYKNSFEHYLKQNFCLPRHL